MSSDEDRDEARASTAPERRRRTIAQRAKALQPVALRHGGTLLADRAGLGEWLFTSDAGATAFRDEVRGIGARIEDRTLGRYLVGLLAPDASRGTVVESAVDKAAWTTADGRVIGPVQVGDVLTVKEPYDHNGFLDLVAADGRAACLHATEIATDDMP